MDHVSNALHGTMDTDRANSRRGKLTGPQDDAGNGKRADRSCLKRCRIAPERESDTMSQAKKSDSPPMQTNNRLWTICTAKMRTNTRLWAICSVVVLCVLGSTLRTGGKSFDTLLTSILVGDHFETICSLTVLIPVAAILGWPIQAIIVAAKSFWSRPETASNSTEKAATQS